MRHSLCRIVSHMMSLNSRVRNLNVRCFNGYFSLAELIILSDQSAKKQFRSSSFNFQFRSNSPWPLSSSPQYVKQSTVDYRRPPFILVLNIYEYSISKNISNADLYLRTICAPVVKLSLKISTEHQCSQITYPAFQIDCDNTQAKSG